MSGDYDFFQLVAEEIEKIGDSTAKGDLSNNNVIKRKESTQRVWQRQDCTQLVMGERKISFGIPSVNTFRNKSDGWAVGEDSDPHLHVMALYRVEEVNEEYARLEAMHVDLFDRGRPDLRQVKYDRTTVGDLQGGIALKPKDLFAGDLVIVHKLKLSDLPSKNMEDPKMRNWIVERCQVYWRKMWLNRLSVVAKRALGFGAVDLSIEGRCLLVHLDTSRNRLLQQDAILMINAFEPLRIARRYLNRAIDEVEEHRQFEMLENNRLPIAPSRLFRLKEADPQFIDAFLHGNYPADDIELMRMLYRRFGTSTPAAGLIEAENESNGCYCASAQIFIIESNEWKTKVKFVDDSLTSNQWMLADHISITLYGEQWLQVDCHGVIEDIDRSSTSRARTIFCVVRGQSARTLALAVRNDVNQRFGASAGCVCAWRVAVGLRVREFRGEALRRPAVLP